MKTPNDPRHLKRVHIMQELFAWEFNSQKETGENLEEIIQNLPKIDDEIKKAAPTWPIDKINKIDLSILRLAIYELIIVKDAPFKVIVDEAVELAKEFGTESSPAFVNGALGNVIDVNKMDEGQEDKKN